MGFPPMGGFRAGGGFHSPGGSHALGESSFGGRGPGSLGADSFGHFQSRHFWRSWTRLNATLPISRFWPGHSSVAASVRINLDRPGADEQEHQIVAAIAVDPDTGETWAAIGDALVRVDKDGNVLDTFYLAAPDGSALRASAIVVEPGRLLIATDFRGIFEFARPDKQTPAALVPQTVSPAP